MTLIVTTPPAEEPLTLAEAKLHLRVDHDADDALIESLITAARQRIEIETRRCLVTQTLQLKLDAFPVDGSLIELRRPPISGITSITYLDTAGDSQTLSSSGYRLLLGEPGRVELAYGESWPSTRDVSQAVTITFTAGYGLAASVPEMAKAAMCLAIGGMYEHREDVNVGNIVNAMPAYRSLVSLLKWGGYQ